MIRRGRPTLPRPTLQHGCSCGMQGWCGGPALPAAPGLEVAIQDPITLNRRYGLLPWQAADATD
jgi:hypothetical protein